MHNRVRELKARIVVELEDYEVASQKLKIITNEMESKYPDLKTNVTGTDEMKKLVKSKSDVSESGSLSTTKSNINFGDNAPEEVFGWVLGKVSPDNEILTMLFGQFTPSLEVPESKWIYMGLTLKNHYYWQVSTPRGICIIYF